MRRSSSATCAFSDWMYGFCRISGIESGCGFRSKALEAPIERFLLRAVGSGARRRFVQLIQPRDDDVLAILERERVLILAILRHGALAGLDDRLLARQLLREPLEAALHVLPAQLEVLLHVLFGQRVGRVGRQRRVGRDEHDIDETAGADRLHRDPRHEVADLPIGDRVRPAYARSRHAAREIAAGQDPVLRLEVRLRVLQ